MVGGARGGRRGEASVGVQGRALLGAMAGWDMTGGGGELLDSLMVELQGDINSYEEALEIGYKYMPCG